MIDMIKAKLEVVNNYYGITVKDGNDYVFIDNNGDIETYGRVDVSLMTLALALRYQNGRENSTKLVEMIGSEAVEKVSPFVLLSIEIDLNEYAKITKDSIDEINGVQVGNIRMKLQSIEYVRDGKMGVVVY